MGYIFRFVGRLDLASLGGRAGLLMATITRFPR